MRPTASGGWKPFMTTDAAADALADRAVNRGGLDRNGLPGDGERARLRRTIYAILMAAGVGGLLGRIGAVDFVSRMEIEKYFTSNGYPDYKARTPFLSANDRSRWLTIRSLVERGT